MTNINPPPEDVLLKNVLQRSDQIALEDEANLKEHVIGPVLRALGWDTGDPAQVKLEFSTYANRGNVDYGLFCDGRPTVFLEVKRAGTDLDKPSPVTQESPEDQLFRYLQPDPHNEPLVPIAILTNGFEWRLYYTQAADNEWLFVSLDLLNRELVDVAIARDVAVELQAYLGRQSVCEGSAEAKAKDVVAERQRWHQLVRDVLPNLWKRFKSDVEDKFDEDLIPEEILRALQHLIRTERDITDADETTDEHPGLGTGRRPAQRITAIRLLDHERRSRTSREALSNLWELLRETLGQDFGDKLLEQEEALGALIKRGVNGTTPFQPWRTNQHLSGTDYWADLYGGTDEIITRMRRICRAFGYNRDDLRIQVDGEWLD